MALARVLSRSGTWIVLPSTSLAASGSRRAAVIVEPAHPARITPLLMSAYDFTEREQQVTVQEHLKRSSRRPAFRSRRELVGKVFFAHYEPRFRDNENRALDGDPSAASRSATSRNVAVRK